MKGRRYCRVLTRTKDCPLSFNQWLVYSYLYCWKKPARPSKVASALRIDKKTLVRVKKELLEQGLIERKRKLIYKEPRPGLFVEYEKGLSFWLYYLPSKTCSFTNTQNAVYWLLYSLTNSGKKRIPSGKALAAMLNISRPTVKKALEVIRAMQLIKDGKVIDYPPENYYRKSKPARNPGVYKEMSDEEKTEYLLKQFWHVYGERLQVLRKPTWEGTSHIWEGKKYTCDVKYEVTHHVTNFIKGAVSRNWPVSETIKVLGMFVAVGERYRGSRLPGGWQPVSNVAKQAVQFLIDGYNRLREEGYTGNALLHATIGWFYRDWYKWIKAIYATKHCLGEWETYGPAIVTDVSNK